GRSLDRPLLTNCARGVADVPPPIAAIVLRQDRRDDVLDQLFYANAVPNVAFENVPMPGRRDLRDDAGWVVAEVPAQNELLARHGHEPDRQVKLVIPLRCDRLAELLEPELAFDEPADEIGAMCPRLA